MENYKKIIQIDLDGVLNNYDGNYNNGIIAEPRAGVREFLEKLSSEFDIEILTVQNKINTVLWLQKHELLNFISDVTNVKNQFATLFIDDRALNFNGDFEKIFEEIKDFKPYWNKSID